MIELKPCPFCGGEAELEKLQSAMYERVISVTVRCKKCKAKIKPIEVSDEYCTVDKAAEAWNRRDDNG